MVWGCWEKGTKRLTITVMILGGASFSALLAYLAFGDATDEEGLRTLRMIHVIFRHGDRNPTDFYPNDPHRNLRWPGGLGALTEKGIVQSYNLGKNLRPRYHRLFPSNGLYSQEDINVVSSYAERCIMSAQSFLAGFLPPLENKNPLPLMWQPIAIHTIPRDRDTILAQKKNCPKYDKALQGIYAYPPKDVREMNEQSQELYRILSAGTGKNISKLVDVEFIYNTLEIEKNAGLELPDWAEGIFPDKMFPLAQRSLSLFTDTVFMKKIKGGEVVKEFLSNMVQKRSRVLVPDRNMFIYSGHDISLVNFMRALNVIGQATGKPDFASAIVIEMHHSITYEDDFEIRVVYYYNSEDRYPTELELPSCKTPCSLTQFQKAMETNYFKDYDEACATV